MNNNHRRLTLGVVRRTCNLAVLITTMFACNLVYAQGTPPGLKGKPLPTYAGRPDDCYQLLKNQDPYVQGGDYPVCGAVLGNFNRYCAEPPQYDRRRIHPQSKDLREPVWRELAAAQNLDLVKETFLAPKLRRSREAFWVSEGPRVTRLAQAGTLQLFEAEVDLNLRLGRQALYKVEGYNETPGTGGYDQPRLMITAAAAPRAATPLAPLSFELAANLWQHRQAWYLVHFEPSELRFFVKELLRPRSGDAAPITALTRCTIMHAADNR